MEQKFAKLFELENGVQVLLTEDYDERNDEFVLYLRTDVGGLNATVKLVCNTEAKQQEAFEKYNLEGAKKFRTEMEKNFL